MNDTLRQAILDRTVAPLRPIDQSYEVGQMLALSRSATRELRRTDRTRAAQRKQRVRAQIAAQIVGSAKVKTSPEPTRLEMAWEVVTPLSPLIEMVAEAKGRKAAYHLGLLAEDVAADIVLELVNMLASSDRDMGDLLDAARSIAGEEVEGAAKGRKFLYQAVNVMTRQYLADAYRAADARPEIGMSDAVMAQLDTLADPWDHHSASRAPQMMGADLGRWDALVLTLTLTTAITDRRLDPLVELILHHTRTDGAFQWERYAREVFLLDPAGRGVQNWAMVVQATAHLKDPEHARANAARLWVRQQFEFMPGLIARTLVALEPRPRHA